MKFEVQRSGPANARKYVIHFGCSEAAQQSLTVVWDLPVQQRTIDQASDTEGSSKSPRVLGALAVLLHKFVMSEERDFHLTVLVQTSSSSSFQLECQLKWREQC